MRVLGTFLGIVTALLTSRYPVGPLVFLVLTLHILTQSFQCHDDQGSSVECRLCGTPRPPGLELTQGEGVYSCRGLDQSLSIALSGFSYDVAWIVFLAFQLGRAVQVTGLGRRLALMIVRFLGSSLLGLGYALSLTELILSPIIPSNTARGGVMMPIAMSISRSLHSLPDHSPRAGIFLSLTAAHANLITSALFLTASVTNPLIVVKAKAILGLEVTWGTWAAGASVPCIILLLATPPLIWIFCGGGRVHTEVKEARGRVREELSEMGWPSVHEILLFIILTSSLVLWGTLPLTGLPPTLIALLAFSALLVTGTMGWAHVVGNAPAWDALFWLGGLLTLVDQLARTGVIDAMGQSLSQVRSLTLLSPLSATISLGLLYFSTSLLFPSLLTHAITLAGIFFTLGNSLHCPPYLLFALIAYFTSLSGSLTYFSSGHAIIYFGQGYVTQQRWYLVGLVISLLHITVFLTFGLAWWKILGWF
ncbi:Sodium/sulfate symporter [Piptocephalis cylindrospora]|uniref:Sodium/sulfate symporter n=1 Tax=Piptocephalis cylindrospora TaxID=1907219 RepID=A0A4P9Y987_9FUNG|nr:Sodium/sulfate symporter [Piptocephalis cylindrospora]|eukprot:RKP15394.1 Sodium/sulfate symporter [Piptocephalis cylindrospora]